MVKDIVGRVALFFLKVLGFLFYLQPRKLQLFWGSWVGFLLFHIKFRGSVIQQNLALAFPNDSVIQKRVFRKNYFYLGNLVLEILMLLAPLNSMKRFVLKNVSVSGLENIQNALKSGKGAIFLSSHVGNWEVMAAAGSLIAKVNLMLVTKHLKPEWLHQAVEKGRAQYGVRATYEPRTFRDILSHLKKNGIVGFVLDQYAGPPVGVRVPLFGVPVGTSSIVAALAKRTDAKVLPTVIFMKEDGSYQIEVRPALDWKKYDGAHYDLAANTARYTDIIEQDILNHPEQWLWIHRRFKGDLSPLHDREWQSARIRN